MTFSGDLRGISLVDIFQNIAGNLVSGTLRVQWRNTERFVRFEDGKIAGFSLGLRAPAACAACAEAARGAASNVREAGTHTGGRAATSGSSLG